MAEILIVEANETLATAEAYRLWNAGHSVQFASTGEEGLDKFMNFTPDLTLLDYELPDTNGLEVLKTIRKTSPQAPVIMITGQGSEELAVKVLKAGAKEYLIKSDALLETLAEEVAQVLREDRVRRELQEKEKALHQAYNLLEKRIQDRTEDLARTNKRLEEEIAERRKAEGALKESEERFRLTFEQAAVGIGHQDPGGRFLWVNSRYAELLGYSRVELLKLSCEDVTHPDYREEDNRFQSLMLRGVLDAHSVEKQYIRKDGSVMWGKVTASVVRKLSGQAEYFVVVLEDRTEHVAAEQEKKNLERQLRQAQKMEALGTLAGGIAHDFNNILGAIFGHTELAISAVNENKDPKVNLEQVLKAGNRAKNLVRQILSFSRLTEQEQRPINIDYLVKEVLKLLRATLPTTIEIRRNLAKETGCILADPTQIHQVLMNLCTNAAHAMKEHGGILTVGLRDVEIDSGTEEKLLDVQPGRYQELTVGDTGHGMEKETLERIFDPYFTTKVQDEGTGLGLAVVHGIVKSHGGAIRAVSIPGQGSTFHCYLPLIEPRREEKCRPQAEQVPLGTERILFVDDETTLADLGGRALNRFGYEVTCCKRSLEALDQFRSTPDNYDLVITDQTMPSMTGMELATELLKIRPDLPIILCTGYSQQVTAEQALGLGVKRFLLKPLVIRQIAKTIREVLDENGNGNGSGNGKGHA